MKKRYSIIIIILLIILLGGGVWFGLERNKKEEIKKQEVVKQEEIKTDPKEISEIDTSDWQTYRNEELGFEFKYPKNWNAKEKTCDDCVMKYDFSIDIKWEKEMLNYLSILVWKNIKENNPKDAFISRIGTLSFLNEEKLTVIDGRDVYCNRNSDAETNPKNIKRQCAVIYKNNLLVFNFDEKSGWAVENGLKGEVEHREKVSVFESILQTLKF